MAQDATDAAQCQLFKIPARSLDFNPTEDVFHLVGNKLRKDGMEKNISKETLEQFCWQIKNDY